MTINDSLQFFGSLLPIIRVQDARGRLKKQPLEKGYNGYHAKPYPIQAFRRDIVAEQFKSYEARGVNAYASAPILAGLAAVDVDNEDAYLELEEMGITLDGPHVRTPNGGWHFYYKLPKEPSPHLTQSRDGIIKGADYRCDNFRYILVPGSWFPDDDGNPKMYTVSGDLNNAPPMPETLARLLESKPLRGDVDPEEEAGFDVGERTGLEDIVEGVDTYPEASERDWAYVLSYLEKLKSRDGGTLPLDSRELYKDVAMVLKYNNRPLEDFKRICWPEEVAMGDAYLYKIYETFKPRKAQGLGKLIFILRENGYPGFKLQKDEPKKQESAEPEPTPEAPPPMVAGNVIPEGEKVPLEWFPEVIRQEDKPPRLKRSFKNFEVMIKAYGLNIWFDEMSHRMQATMPGRQFDNGKENSITSLVFNMAILNDFPQDGLDKLTDYAMYNNCRNPVKEFLEALPKWDEKDHFIQFYNTVKPRLGIKKAQKETYLRKFLMQCIASVYQDDFSQHGALTFQGAQGIGKTTWFRRLVPKEYSHLVLTGARFDQGTKDEKIAIYKHWIAELGEVEGATKKADVSALKNFMTMDKEDIRQSYGRYTETFKRKTILSATVNDQHFLNDDTGSRRFWAIPVETLEPFNGDVLQLWAQAKWMYLHSVEKQIEYLTYLTPDEEKERELTNAQFQDRDVWLQYCLKYYGQASEYTDEEKKEWREKDYITIHKEILSEVGIENVQKMTNQESRAIGKALRVLGYVQKVNGARKFALPGIRVQV